MSSQTSIASSDAVDSVPGGHSRGFSALFRALIIATITAAGPSLVWLACRLSARGANSLAWRLTRWLEPLTRERRHANLRRFFRLTDSADEQLQALDDAHLRYLARLRAEIARSFEGSGEDLKKTVTMEGEEYLRSALAQRRGVMLVSGHIATYWFLPAILAAYGHPVTAIFTPIKSRRLERMLLQYAERYGVRISFVGRDARKAVLNAIRNNEILYLSFDVAMRPRRKACFPFGGGSLEIDPSPAILAVRSAMPTLQAACLQLEGGKNKMSFYAPEPVELSPQTSNEMDLCRIWTQRLEKEVTLHPAQWWPWGYLELLKSSPAGEVPTTPQL